MNVFAPMSLSPDVLTDASTGFYSAASGGSVVSTNGTVVNGWVNAGTLGARMPKLSDANGPRYRPNSGAPYLEFSPTGGAGYALSCDLGGTAAAGDMTVHILFRAGVPHSGHRWLVTPESNGVNGGSGLSLIIRDRYSNIRP